MARPPVYRYRNLISEGEGPSVCGQVFIHEWLLGDSPVAIAVHCMVTTIAHGEKERHTSLGKRVGHGTRSLCSPQRRTQDGKFARKPVCVLGCGQGVGVAPPAPHCISLTEKPGPIIVARRLGHGERIDGETS